MTRLYIRGCNWDLMISGAITVAGLTWLITSASALPLVSRCVILVAGAAILYPGLRVLIDGWRQILVLEDERLIYFDGKTHHEFAIADIRLIRLNRWSGSRLQSAGHSLALLPRDDGKVEHWDIPDFSLRAVLRIICELARRADWPPIEICQTEFQSLGAELRGAVRGLGTLSPKPLEEVDETTLSRWDKEIRGYERRYCFEPHGRSLS